MCPDPSQLPPCPPHSARSKLTFRMKMKRRSVNALRQKMGPKIGGLFHAKMKHAPPMKLHTGMEHPVGPQSRLTYPYGGEPASE